MRRPAQFLADVEVFGWSKHEAVDVAAIAEQARAEFAQSLAAQLLKMVGDGGELPVNGHAAMPTAVAGAGGSAVVLRQRHRKLRPRPLAT